MENIKNANNITESAESHFDKGNALYNQGDYESAISAYDNALDLNPDLATAYFNRGNAKSARSNDTLKLFQIMIRLYSLKS